MNDYQIQSIIDYKDIANEFFVFQIDNCDQKWPTIGVTYDYI